MHVAPLDEGRLTALFGGIARSSSSEAGEGEEEQVAPPARKTPASARGTLWQHPASAACSTPRRLLGSDSEEELLQHAAPRWASPARSPLPSSQPASAARAGTTLHQATPCCAARSTSSGHGCSSGDDGTSQRVQRWTPPSSSGDEGSSSAEEAARTPHWLRWAQRHFVGSGSSSSGSPAAASPAASLGRETPVAQPSPHKLSASASRRPRRSLAPVMAGAALPAGQAAPPGGDGPQAPPPLFAVLPLMVPAEAAAYLCLAAEAAAAAAAASPGAAQQLGEHGADWRIGAAGAWRTAPPVAPLPVVSAAGSPQAWKQVLTEQRHAAVAVASQSPADSVAGTDASVSAQAGAGVLLLCAAKAGCADCAAAASPLAARPALLRRRPCGEALT